MGANVVGIAVLVCHDVVLASGAVDRLRVVAEAAWGSAHTPVRAGLSFDRIDASFAARGDTSKCGRLIMDCRIARHVG